MLELKRLNGGYGRAQVLFDLDLELPIREIHRHHRTFFFCKRMQPFG